MLFNSVEFAVFLPAVFLLYWFVFAGSVRLQNLFLVAVSYLFYGWWDWRFLSLLFISSMTDYLVGRGLGRAERPRPRRWLLGASLAINLGLVGTFKYYNFFVDSLVDALAAAGLSLHVRTLHVILPVGISFYTFQTLSYTIDVYRRRLAPTRDPLAFFAFVSFFPQLVAGPIERATHLLPQFQRPLRDYVYLPLGGSWGRPAKVLRNVLVVFVVSGLWHGASWTFVAWGFLNALYFLPLMLAGRHRRHRDVPAAERAVPGPRELARILLTFGLTLIAWVFFRAETLPDAFTYLAGLLSTDLLARPTEWGPLHLVLLLVVWEWLQRRREHGLQIGSLPVALRWPIYLFLVFVVLAHFDREQEFLYFQF